MLKLENWGPRGLAHGVIFKSCLRNFRKHHAKAWCFFISGLRPTGSRGFGCDRCRGQEEGAAKGEETGSVPTDQREGEQTTMFRGGTSQVQILSPQFNKKHHTRKCVVFFCCVKMSHAEAGKLGSRGSFQIPVSQKETGMVCW